MNRPPSLSVPVQVQQAEKTMSQQKMPDVMKSRYSVLIFINLTYSLVKFISPDRR
jgi:hypothetical protein